MTVTVNGAPRDVPDGTRLGDLAELAASSARGTAAAVDGEVVSRGAWAVFALRDGHHVELLTAVQGG